MSLSVPPINNWQLAKIHWKAQALSNIFFGLTIVLIFLVYERWSPGSILAATLLYLSVYGLILVPYFGLLPVFLVKGAKKTLIKITQGQAVGQDEARQALATLINLPRRLAVIIFFSVLLAFGFGLFLLTRGLIPEFMPFIQTFVFSGTSLGVVVAVMHSFFNYIMLDNYLRPFGEFLAAHYPNLNMPIKRLPLFKKIFALVLFSTLAAQITLADLFVSHIWLREPQALGRTSLFVLLVLAFSLLYVFAITSLFTRHLIRPLERIIAWTQARIRSKTPSGEPLNLVVDDEVADVIAYTKKLLQDLEESKQVLEIKVRARTSELQELAQTLEHKVAQRTRELQQRLEQLEKFHRLTVGRELKMIELKKELAKFKTRLAQSSRGQF